jgi:hypothetical protein
MSSPHVSLAEYSGLPCTSNIPTEGAPSLQSCRYFIARDVYCNDVGDGVVFLDARSGDYSAITTAQSQALSPLVVGWPTGLPSGLHQTADAIPAEIADKLAQQLVDRGLLTADRTNAATPPPSHHSAIDSMDFLGLQDTDRPIHLIDRVRFVIAVVVASGIKSFKPLPKLLAPSHTAQSAYPRVDEAVVRSYVDVFRRIRIYFYTAHDHCLFDSLALRQFLKLSGIRSTLVFGVATRPFGAHSWLQHGGLVLTDPLVRIHRYTPIVAVSAV